MPRPEPLARIGLLLALALPAAAPAHAQQTDDAPSKARLGAVEQELDAARRRAQELGAAGARLARDVAEARRQAVALASAIQEKEATLAALEERLDVLRDEEDAALTRLETRRAEHADVVGALHRIARHPPEALIAQPMSTNDVVRSAILLRAAVPLLERSATDLAARVSELAATRADIRERRQDIERHTAALQGQRQDLDALLARKRQLFRDTETEQRRAANEAERLARKAESLRDLVERLEAARRAREEDRRRRAAEAAERRRLAALAAPPPPKPTAPADDEPAPAARPSEPADEAPQEASAAAAPATVALHPPDQPPISDMRGRLVFPAAGSVEGHFGDKMEAGLTRKGITIKTRVGAQVVAPYGGKVAYAGPFRGYGLLLIIEHGDGYHSLISGLGRINPTVGQWVVAGEPVGVMGQPPSGQPVLYVEIRHDSQPIDPEPWLSARNRKA